MLLTPPKLTSSEYSALLRRTESIPGWLNVSEQAILYALGKSTSGPILEMGCFKGKSTTCFLSARATAGTKETHIVVDVFKDHLDAGRGDFEQDFRHNVAPFAGATELQVLRMSTFEAGEALGELSRPFGGFAGIFIDADHSYAAVLKDGVLAHNLLRPGGWLAFHDAIRWEGNTSVLPACLDIAELNPYGFVGTYSSILLIQKPSAQETFPSWKETPKIKAYAAWGRSVLASALGKGTGLIMGSPLGKAFSKGRRLVQRMRAPTA